MEECQKKKELIFLYLIDNVSVRAKIAEKTELLIMNDKLNMVSYQVLRKFSY